MTLLRYLNRGHPSTFFEKMLFSVVWMANKAVEIHFWVQMIKNCHFRSIRQFLKILNFLNF